MIDALAGQSHFGDHIQPIWEALPDDIRGTFYRQSFALKASANPTLTASAGDMKVAMSRRRPVALMEHGCGQSFGGDPRSDKFASYAGNAGRDGVGLFLHPGEHPAGRDRKRYPGARIEVIGCPKLDRLPRKARGDTPVVAVSFHWNCTLVPETEPALGFLPQLEELAKRYEVIGHGHPKWGIHLRSKFQRLGIEWVPTFEQVCARADLYVNDCSSTLFEFAATGRPVVVMNKGGQRAYRRDINHGLRFWDAASVGVNVEERDDLTEAVAQALEDAPEQRQTREDALDLVYAYRSGGAQRAVEALVDWAGEQAVAA